MKHLLVLLAPGATPETAQEWKSLIQKRLGIPVTILIGANQALIVETDVKAQTIDESELRDLVHDALHDANGTGQGTDDVVDALIRRHEEDE